MANQAPAHWSKDFVAHLRAVHFALIAICAGLIVLVLSSKEYNAVNALVELQGILDLKEQWSINWITSHRTVVGHTESTIPQIESVFRTDLPKSLSSFAEPTLYIPDESIIGKYKDPRTHETVTVECHLPKRNWEENLAFEEYWSPTKFPRTLREFQTWWDRLSNGSPPLYVPDGLFDFWSVSSNVFDFDFHDLIGLGGEVGNQKNRKVVVDLILNASVAKRETIDKGLVLSYIGQFKFGGKTLYLTIPIESYATRVVTQEAISGDFVDLRPGLFSQSFQDLSIAARGEATLPLETVREFLRDEVSKGPEVFEAFGMKFPAGQITFWGVVLLLSVQLYFIVYLRQLSGKLKPEDPGWDVPWIGMDSSLLSKIILYVSLVVLPCTAAFLLAWQATIRLSSGYWERLNEHWYHPIHFLPSPWHQTVILKILFLILAAIASGYLGLLSWKYRPQIVPELPSCPAQLFE